MEDAMEKPGNWYIWQIDKRGRVFRSCWGYASLEIAVLMANEALAENPNGFLCVGSGNI